MIAFESYDQASVCMVECTTHKTGRGHHFERPNKNDKPNTHKKGDPDTHPDTAGTQRPLISRLWLRARNLEA